MRGLDLLQGVVEAHMTDVCVIKRDAEGTADDTMNQTTGILTPAVGDPATVYSGPCLVYPAGRQAVETEGGFAYTEKEYVGAIPLGSAQPEVGDWFTVTSSGDARFTSRDFRVKAVEASTFAVSREMRLEDRA